MGCLTRHQVRYPPTCSARPRHPWNRSGHAHSFPPAAVPEIASGNLSALDRDFEEFRHQAYRLARVDLTYYKVPQMQRRLTTLLARAGAASFAEYALVLARNPRRQQEFRDFITINVSEFFRDEGRFADLERSILPDLLRATPGRGLRIWSAGCSIGAEPYSLAMLLRELAPGRSHAILATDIDETILQRARAGANYLPADVRNVSPERLKKWFTQEPGGCYTLHSAVRSTVTFQKHDLVRDRYPAGPFDLVVCRNVMIYFTEEAKERIYRGFLHVIRPGGMLFVGGTEVVMHALKLGLQPLKCGFYGKSCTG